MCWGLAQVYRAVFNTAQCLQEKKKICKSDNETTTGPAAAPTSMMDTGCSVIVKKKLRFLPFDVMKRLFMLESSELHLVVAILTVSWKRGRWKGTLRGNQGKQEKFRCELQWINSVYLKNLSNSLKMWGKETLYKDVFILAKEIYRTPQCVIFTVEIGFHHSSTSSVNTNAWKLAHIYLTESILWVPLVFF